MFLLFVFLLRCCGVITLTFAALSLTDTFVSCCIVVLEGFELSEEPSRWLRWRISPRSQLTSSDALTSNSSLRTRLLILRPRSLLSCLAITIQLWLSSLYRERTSSSDEASTASSALISFAHNSWIILIPTVRRTVASKLATKTSHYPAVSHIYPSLLYVGKIQLTLRVFQNPLVSVSACFRNALLEPLR